jgi:hypothetical protein
LHARRGVIVQSTTGGHTMTNTRFEDIVVEILGMSDGDQPVVPVSIIAGTASIENVSIVNCRSGFPSFSAIFNRKMQKLPLFSWSLIRNEGKTAACQRHRLDRGTEWMGRLRAV